MTDQEIEAITGGYHGDAFSILGPHPTTGKQDNSRSGWEVRAFLPQAKELSLLWGGKTVPTERIHPNGFFQASIPERPERYTFAITNYEGIVSEVEDPYRFAPVIGDLDLHLHSEGSNNEGFHSFGAHLKTIDGVAGTAFAVWAPNAIVVGVTGDFNGWDDRRNPMRLRSGGVWEIFMPGVGAGAAYKYSVKSKFYGYRQLKSDPYGFASEAPPATASIVTDLQAHEWGDQAWMEERARTKILESPMSVYEVHLGSWVKDDGYRTLTYKELAHRLVAYVKKMGYTHIELMPVAEHPYTPSWGYQVTGYFAPTARYGSPQDFMVFVDSCHQAGIGVIMDWVPAHFPKDAHGLAFFDGTALYEHADPRLGEHRDWGTLIFNFGRNEVRSFLISNAMFWLKKYHIDGLRVDAVASMLYLDYSRKAGEWIPNMYGGNENLEAISFLRKTNELVHQVPGAITVAEESTSFSGVSRPVYLNGLGFTMKWNMGWMHDMLDYFSYDPIHRKFHQNEVTFSIMYAFAENFVLPVSHDEVVYGKKSLLGKMPGDEWRQFANVRAFLAYMWAHPGKKLLFMGQEIGQREEWNHDGSIPWEILEFDYHRKLQSLVRELNRIYRASPAMYEVDFHYSGFEWVDFHDGESSVIAFLRRAEDPKDFLLFCCNFTPVPRQGYEFGVPEEGFYEEILNTDSEMFGGSNTGNGGMVSSRPIAKHNRPHSISVTLPPLAVVAFRRR
jgi:1,4-alpha-glucan branching enzyme